MTIRQQHQSAAISPVHAVAKPDTPDSLITLDEVAAQLRVPLATLRYWRHLGTGPRGFRIGRHVRFYRGDVDDWLDEQRNADHDPS